MRCFQVMLKREGEDCWRPTLFGITESERTEALNNNMAPFRCTIEAAKSGAARARSENPRVRYAIFNLGEV